MKRLRGGLNPAQKKTVQRCGAGFLAGLLVFGGSLNVYAESKGAYAYLSEGNYKMLLSLDSDSKVPLQTLDDDVVDELYTKDWLMQFSPDGKYLYYFRDVDDYEGTLCRIECKKIKKDSSKNNEYVEEIDTEVQSGFKFATDNTIIYTKVNYSGDEQCTELYYWDGNEKTQLTKDVDEYITDGEGKIVYTAYRDSTDSRKRLNIYGVSTDDLQNKKKLASGISYTENFEDVNNIFYMNYVPAEVPDYEEDNDDCEYYVAGWDKEPIFLGTNLKDFWVKDGTMLYVAPSGSAGESTGLVENQKEVTTYEPLDSSCSEDDYDEIYTSCTQNCFFLYNEASIDGQEEEEFQDFTAKYEDLEDEYGYFPVTDEIKKALQDITTKYGNGFENEWLEFCFEKKTEIQEKDDDDWLEEYGDYEEEDMSEEDEQNQPKDILYYKDGEITTISTGISQVKLTGNCCKYYDENNSMFLAAPSDNGVQNIKISGEAQAYCEKAGDGSYYIIDDTVYFNANVLTFAPIQGNSVEKFSRAADDVGFLLGYWVDDTIYYMQNRGNSSYDLYSCTKGTCELKAENISYDYAELYEDGTFLISLDHPENTYELDVITQNGERNVIADEVTQHIKLDDKNILYISDSDLYVYDGKDSTLLDIDVDYVWSSYSAQKQDPEALWYYVEPY